LNAEEDEEGERERAGLFGTSKGTEPEKRRMEEKQRGGGGGGSALGLG